MLHKKQQNATKHLTFSISAEFHRVWWRLSLFYLLISYKINYLL